MTFDHMFYPLSHVERIEVIRGPGSTLWGSEAAMGIIHVITKDGGRIDSQAQRFGSLEINYDYEIDQKRHNLNATYGKSFDDGNFMLSTTYLNSDAPWKNNFRAGPAGIRQLNRKASQWDFEDSYDIYTKAEYKDLLFKGRSSEFESHIPTHTRLDGSRVGWRTSERDWAEVLYSPDFGDHLSMDVRVYYDHFSDYLRRDFTNGNFDLDRSEKASGFGIEAILNYRSDNYSLKLGVLADEKDFRYLERRLRNGNISEFNHITNFTDRNKAVFLEGIYTGIENWRFTAGIRYDDKSPRDDESAILPRVAAVWLIDDRWTAKYIFNTGNVRPTGVQKRGPDGIAFRPQNNRWVKGAEKAQEVESHEFQITYRNEKFEVNLNLFSTEIKDIILNLQRGSFTFNGINNVQLWDTNVAAFNTIGVELEFNARVGSRGITYGNYAYTDAEYDSRDILFQGQKLLDLIDDTTFVTNDLTPTGTPAHTWNLGIDWTFTSEIKLNLHYRGWDGIWSKSSTAPATYRRWGPEHFFDANLSWQSISEKQWSISMYAKNIFQNSAPFPDSFFGAYSESQRDGLYGVEIGWTF